MANQSQIQQCIQGLQRLLSDSDFAADCLNSQDLCQLLSDGDVLCTVLTQLSNGRISNDDGTYSAINSQFMAKSNLKFFVEQCQEEFGMCEDELFEPDDLLTMSNPEKVVSSIHKLVSKSGQVVPKPRRQSNISVGGGMMDNIIKEICDHEKALVDKLTKLLLYRQELLGLLSEWSEEFVEVVFRHTEQLYLVHKEFHEKLSALADQGCEQFCKQLKPLFCEMVPKLEIYKEYFSHMPTAQKRMEEEFKRSPVQKHQITKLEKHFSNGQVGLVFHALFSAPIRQPTSCLMLFQRLQKAAGKDFPDAANDIGEVAAGVQDLLNRANEYKRQAEHIAVTKAILGQICKLPKDLADPALIGLHLADECFKVKTVKQGKVESQICTCLVTTKQVIFATRLQKKECQYNTYAFHIPIESITDVKNGDKASGLEISRKNGDRVVLECQKRREELEKWKKLLLDAKSSNFPTGWNSNGHKFELKTLPEGSQCSECQEILPGSFMQGYSCAHCDNHCHLRCMQRFVGLPAREVDHGNLSRDGSKELLKDRPEGTFLIRNSRTGGKALSLKTSTEIKHINIVESNGKCSLGENTKAFDSLDQLLDFYRVNKLSIHFTTIDCTLNEGIEFSTSN